MEWGFLLGTNDVFVANYYYLSSSWDWAGGGCGWLADDAGAGTGAASLVFIEVMSPYDIRNY